MSDSVPVRSKVLKRDKAHVYTRSELRACARKGHATYRPDEADLADRLHLTTPGGEAWRCLRCGDWAPGAPAGSGPAQDAPLVLRGKALRSALVLRLLSVERAVRAILLVGAAYGVLRFSADRSSIQAALNRDLPALHNIGINIDQLALVKDLQKQLTEKPDHFKLIALLLLGYALIEAVEAVGLWLTARWGEYFAAVATAVFLPFEVSELAKGFSAFKLGAFLLNVAAVAYLIASKRLFGLRGGAQAYEKERRGEQLLEVEQAALTS